MNLENRHRILHSLPDLKMGGGQNVVLRTVAYLDWRHFENHLCYFLPHQDMEELFIKERVQLQLFHHYNLLSSPKILYNLIHYIRKHKINTIHIHGPPIDKRYAQTAALLCRVPVVRTLHGMKPMFSPLHRFLKKPGLKSLFSLMREPFKWFFDYLLDLLTVKRVIAVSEDVLGSWQSYLGCIKIPPKHIKVLYNAVPLERYTKVSDGEALGALRNELGLLDSYPVLINVGRVLPDKGQDTLLEMLPYLLQRFPKTKLLIVGEGKYRWQLNQMIQQTGLNSSASLLGQRYDIPRLLSLSDIFIFPSRFKFEGFPLVICEAMACQLPVVAFKFPGYRFIIKNGVNGIIVSENKAIALADSVMDIAKDREKVKKMGRAGRQTVEEKFDMNKVILEMETTYQNVLQAWAVSLK